MLVLNVPVGNPYSNTTQNQPPHTLRAVTKEDGTIVKEIEYSAYGEIIKDTNQTLNINIGFAGGLYDSDTKLTRFGYRDYDAKVRKWTAKDPIGFGGGDINLYGYVFNDPVNGIDPLGLKLELCKTGNGEELGYHQFWLINGKQSIGFFPALGKGNQFYSPAGIYLNPDPNQDNDELLCSEYPDNTAKKCIEKCILNYTNNTKTPYYSIYGNQCRTESIKMYQNCFQQCWGLK